MTPWLDDGDVQLHHGDVIDVLRSLPRGIAQTCVTSPPFFGLRDYGVDGQIGLEATVEEYVARLVAVFGQVWRVLRDDGTCWIELGDSYANDAKWGGSSGGKHVMEGQTGGESYRQRRSTGLKGKDLMGVPWMVAFALRDAGWYLRSDIVWSRPNPMPESVTDRPTKSHSYLFLLSKRPRYFWDADAIREELADPTRQSDPYPNTWDHQQASGAGNAIVPGGYKRPAAGARNRRSVWTIATEPFPEAHFATYPQALVRPCILAGTSERGECVECGAPWVREVERTLTGGHAVPNARAFVSDARRGSAVGGSYEGASHVSGSYEIETTGWRASCTCDAPTRPQTVLDPFVGSGTTALVARNHARRCIGIDLSAEYLAIAARRLQQLSLLGGPA